MFLTRCTKEIHFRVDLGYLRFLDDSGKLGGRPDRTIFSVTFSGLFKRDLQFGESKGEFEEAGSF